MRTILSLPLIVVTLGLAAWGEEPYRFNGKTAEGWLAVLRNRTSTDAQRLEAIISLGCFGLEAKAAAPDLIEAVHKERFRDEAVKALVSLSAGAEMTVPILIDHNPPGPLP